MMLRLPLSTYRSLIFRGYAGTDAHSIELGLQGTPSVYETVQGSLKKIFFGSFLWLLVFLLLLRQYDTSLPCVN